jgi:hypothetical protein
MLSKQSVTTLTSTCHISFRWGTWVWKYFSSDSEISLRNRGLPRFPHPTAGQLPTVSPAKQAPPNAGGPSEPDHSVHETSVKFPVKAPRPVGKKAEAPPVSSQISKLFFRDYYLHASSQGRAYWNFKPYWLVGLDTVWPHHNFSLLFKRRSPDYIKEIHTPFPLSGLQWFG